MSRGFTAVELACVLTLTALALPALYAAHRMFEGEALKSEAEVQAAESMRSVAEEIRRDAWTMRWTDADSLSLEGPCGKVRYQVSGDVLIRSADAGCGGARAIARSVRQIVRAGEGVRVTLARRVRADEEWTGTFEVAR